MMILSKVKTLIEYAKFGVMQSIIYNKEPTLYELCFPKSITSYNNNNNNSGWQIQAKAITGHLQTISAQNFLSGNNNVEVIDLPELVNVSGSYALFNRAYGLRICKIPKVKILGRYFFQIVQNLNILKLAH